MTTVKHLQRLLMPLWYKSIHGGRRQRAGAVLCSLTGAFNNGDVCLSGVGRLMKAGPEFARCSLLNPCLACHFTSFADTVPKGRFTFVHKADDHDDFHFLISSNKEEASVQHRRNW